jgi:23S rRNA pseudouridine955/2504/2580 synthase
MSSVERIVITPYDSDQRLDRWLKRRFEHLGQGQIEKWCRKGELRIDGARCKASTRIESGQEVRVRHSHWQALTDYRHNASLCQIPMLR